MADSQTVPPDSGASGPRDDTGGAGSPMPRQPRFRGGYRSRGPAVNEMAMPPEAMTASPPAEQATQPPVDTPPAGQATPPMDGGS
jgi:hypothetical protein